MSADIARVLAEHRVSTVRVGSHAGSEHMPDIGVYEQRCQTCGRISGTQSDHMAEALAPLILRERAEALREAAAEIDRLRVIGKTPYKECTEYEARAWWDFAESKPETWLRARAAAIDPEGAGQ